MAATLHPDTYRNNPTLRAYMEHSGLAFRPHESFDVQDLTERQELYLEMCKKIWSPDLIEQAASPE